MRTDGDESGGSIIGFIPDEAAEIAFNTLIILQLCNERDLTINKLANISALPPSSVKNILYGKIQNPKIVTIKMLCDGLEITLGEFFSTKEFDELEQEIK